MKYQPHHPVKQDRGQQVIRFSSSVWLACASGLLRTALVLAGISISNVAVSSQIFEPALAMASSRSGTGSLEPILDAEETLASTSVVPGFISADTFWTRNDPTLIERRFVRTLRAILTGDSSLEGEGMVRWSGGVPVTLWRVSRDSQGLNPDEEQANEENSLLSVSTAGMDGSMERATRSWVDTIAEESESGSRIQFSHADSLVDQGGERPATLNWTVDVATIEVPGIPEPSVVWIWGMAALGTGMWRWRKRINR
jgi:hypothetical protein